MPVFSLQDRRVELRGANHYIAWNATLVGAIVLEEAVSVWFGAVIRADNDLVHIGAESNIQDGAILHCDPGFPLTVGKRATIGHKVMLHGCTVGDGALIGINSVILNGAKIGAGALIGAGSLVPEGKEIPPGVLAIGSPAKVVRELTPAHLAGMRAAADSYVERARLFRDHLKEQK
jgi:carbonic anhydrase/acetyltransferase-like protein (isoleucine patch superfamily)